MTSHLELHSVSKSFGKRTVLDRVSLRVDPGRIVAVVGQNGSGKSTLLRIAAGLLAASSGAVFRAGAVGYCPQDRGLAGRLTVREHVELFAAGRTSAIDRVMTALKELWVGPEMDDAVASVSGGTQQKLNLALAVASDPDLLLLDEPYQGFDRRSYDAFIAMLGRWRDERRAVVIVTHMIDDPAPYDQVIVLGSGAGT